MASNDRFGTTLVQKGLAIIIVPFLFSCAWLLLLGGIIQKTNQLADLEREQSLYIEHLNAVMDCSYRSRESLLAYLTTKNKKFLTRTDEWISRTRAAITELTGMPKLSTDQRDLASELGEAVEGQLGPIQELVKNGQGQNSDGLVRDFESMRSSITDVLGANDGAAEHIKKQRADLDQARLEVQKSSALANMIVLCGLSGNLMLTLIIVLLFSKSFSNRLKVLVENARRLPKKQELNAPLKGADELAYLDDSLHQTAVELHRAAEFRASLMQMVAHDLRSPLMSCMISLDIILDRESASLSEKGQKQLGAMQINLDRLIGLTNDLLLIEQYENDQLALDRGPENIKEIVEQAIAAVSALAQAKKLTVRNLAAQEYVNVDRNRIVQVVVNYLSNAIKFSPAEGSIEITSEVIPGRLTVSVRDHGKGLTKEEKAKLFQKFAQTKEGKTAGGAGLGLAICKSIVKAHGGSVGVSSESGKGAVFWFYVPMEETRDS